MQNLHHLKISCYTVYSLLPASMTVKLPNTGFTYTSLCMSLSVCWSRPVWEGEGEREGELPSPELFCCSGRVVLSLVDLWEGKRREKGREEGGRRKEVFSSYNTTKQRQTSPAITRVDRETDTLMLRGRTYGREERGRREEKHEMTDTLTLRGRTLRVLLGPLSHR